MQTEQRFTDITLIQGFEILLIEFSLLCITFNWSFQDKRDVAKWETKQRKTAGDVLEASGSTQACFRVSEIPIA